MRNVFNEVKMSKKEEKDLEDNCPLEYENEYIKKLEDSPRCIKDDLCKNKYVIIMFIIFLIIFSFLIHLLFKYNYSELISFLGSVFMALITLMGVIISNKKNRENIIVQLKYEKVAKTIFDLKFYLLDTLMIYRDLKNLDEMDKDKFLTSEDFILLQFLRIISNKDFMGNLPFTLQKEIESKFQYKLKSMYVSYNEKVKNLNEDYILPEESLISSQNVYYDIYQEILQNWNESPRFRGFYSLYKRNKISENELKDHLENIQNVIFEESIEEMILKDHKNI